MLDHRPKDLVTIEIRRSGPFLLCLFLFGSAFAQSENCTQKDASTRPDCPQAIAFFQTFQAAFNNNDRQKVASLVSYPVLTRLHHKRVHITNAAQFRTHYNEIFDRQISCAILAASKRDVWGNWRGFMVARGAIWFDAIVPAGERANTSCPDRSSRYPFKIITINNASYYACRNARASH